MIFLDTETVGFHGVPVLIQYAYDDGPITLYNVWRNPIRNTLELIEDFVGHEGGICGFNLAFDWFHICKIYNTLRLFPDIDEEPQHHITELAKLEVESWKGPCLKPVTALDLMLHARKGPYQSTMDRNDIRIKKVPTQLAWLLAERLDREIELKDIYFANKADPSKRWSVVDITDDVGDIIPDFKDLVLKFAPSSGLKALAVDALNITETDSFGAVNPPSYRKVKELGYAPFAMKIGNPDDWNKSWPFWVIDDAYFWDYNKRAKKYAEDDVRYTRDLYKHFGCPDTGDDDSILACAVAAVRLRGYKISVDKLVRLRAECQRRVKDLEFNVNSPKICRKYLTEGMSAIEKMALTVDGQVTTKGVVLKEIARWTVDEPCNTCGGLGQIIGEGLCGDCRGEGVIKTQERHPSAVRAQRILDARSALKEIENYDKLITAGRFHASFKVIGTLSTRMSGADGLNPQGIKRAKHVRSCFPLADEGMVLTGGDFDSFEMSIQDAVYKDPRMHEELADKSLKFHAVWGHRYFFPHLSYEEILETKGADDPWNDYYTRSKNCDFAICYFGEEHTLVTRGGLDIEVAKAAFHNILKDYPDFARERQDVVDKFCSMRQPGGIGSKVEWHEPAEYIESLLGFRRYFTLENKICRALFNLAENPPKEWNDLKIKVVRRDREQSASSAVRSALFAAAFAIQAAAMRAAGNHRIQSTGGGETKKLQRRLWDLQPSGIRDWLIVPMNIHDEIMAPCVPKLVPVVHEVVDNFVKEDRELIPLLAIDWSDKLESWADK